MSEVLFDSLSGGFKIIILVIYIILINLCGCKSTQLSKIQGQEAYMIFPYPCDSTQVTLQHSYRVPFYQLTDRSTLSLPDDQVPRFRVQNRNKNGNCSLDLTISNLMRSDAGTYISLVYTDRQLIVDLTTRVGLQIDYPPGKASCVVSEEKVGNWVSIDCTANVGSLSGKIECYQDGVRMPSLTDTIETFTLLKQTFLIRKYQPVFCCTSALIEYTERCECDDTALYLDDASSSDPCPTISTKTSTTSTYRTPDLVNNSQSFISFNYTLPSYTTSNNANKMTKDKLKTKITHSILGTALVIMFTLNAIFLHRLRQKRNKSSNDESQDPSFSRKFYSDDAQECVTEKMNPIQFTMEAFATQKTQKVT